jgi:NAD(P)-dependent dehydrogenase (short-subunit alcohol dehydrogenase family)
LGANGGATRASRYVGDLSSLSEVRRLASEIRAEHPRIHVLINNAGAVFARRQQSVDGFELTLALNVLSPFLLTHLLADGLAAAAPARVVNVASDAHRGGRLDFADLEFRRHYSAFGAYSASKLALVLLTYEFARRWSGRGVDVNAVHPGFVRTNFGHNTPGALSMAVRVFEIFAKTPASGARTPLYAATAPELTGVSGRYFDRCQEVTSSKASQDRGTAARLWEHCLSAVGLSPPS